MVQCAASPRRLLESVNRFDPISGLHDAATDACLDFGNGPIPWDRHGQDVG